MLIRRFYQSDLRPSAYAGVVLRIVLVLLIVAVLHQFFALSSTPGAPLEQHRDDHGFRRGLLPARRPPGAPDGWRRRPCGSSFPSCRRTTRLDQLDGLNVWYEARLTEEGVEDMQNLTTMNLVDVILHTRVPVGRLVDWVDQAFLLIHLEPVERKQLAAERQLRVDGGADARSGVRTRIALRRVGIRTATDLLKAMPEPNKPGAAMAATGMDVDQLRVLASVLSERGGPDARLELATQRRAPVSPRVTAQLRMSTAHSERARATGGESTGDHMTEDAA